MNNSTTFSSQDPPCSHVVPSLFIAIMSIISFAAFIGNLLVTVTFLKTPSLRTSTNYYIVNMALSDLLCSGLNWLLYVTEGMLTSKEFITGPLASVVCKLGLYSRGVSQVVSVLSLVLIAVDRYIAIVFPLKAARLVGGGSIRVMLLLLTWIIPVLCGIPYFIYTDTVKVEDHTYCRILWSTLVNAVFNVVGFVVFYCAPLIAMIILYSRIAKALKNRKKAQDSVNSKRQRQNQKITKILISIVVAFFVCWTPLCIYLVLKMLHPDLFLKDKCKIFAALFFYVFPSLSTAINPVILFLFSTNYRQALKSLGLQLSDVFPFRSFNHRGVASSQITQLPEDAVSTGNHSPKSFVMQSFRSRRVSDFPEISFKCEKL